MDETADYSKIAPYQDHEVSAVLDGLKNNPSFINMLQFVDLDASTVELEDLLDSIKTIEDFQQNISKPWMLQFLDKTTSKVTHEGFDSLRHDKKHLFISNHRDIILDSAILNVLLTQSGLQTVETAIGDNLLKFDLVKTLTKLNKNFTVLRTGSRRELYEHSQLLSAYIRHKIVEKGSSIWLAQKEGRAKDGNDQTQQGVLKMLNLSNPGAFEDGFKALHIRPMSLSYEYDPCDRFKVKELLTLEAGEEYIKEEEEDLQNIVAGILEQKGQVHLSIQPELKEELDELADIKNVNDKTHRLAEIIDHSIYRSYKLFENNYVAYDLLHQTKEWEASYSLEKKQAFLDYLEEICKNYPAQAKAILLKKYAYPLINQLNIEQATRNVE